MFSLAAEKRGDEGRGILRTQLYSGHHSIEHLDRALVESLSVPKWEKDTIRENDPVATYEIAEEADIRGRDQTRGHMKG